MRFDNLKSNPYTAKGECIPIDARLAQLLDKSSGLYKIILPYEMEVLFYIEFGKHAAAQSFTGIAKFNGAYQYTAVSGKQVIIPKLKAILPE